MEVVRAVRGILLEDDIRAQAHIQYRADRSSPWTTLTALHERYALKFKPVKAIPLLHGEEIRQSPSWTHSNGAQSKLSEGGGQVLPRVYGSGSL